MSSDRSGEAGTGGGGLRPPDAANAGIAANAANLKTVFAGLMLGMFLAAVNQTIIAPAMPRIVAELGGMAHYSWIAVSALLASTVIVPVVGKLSDLYGRKAFYVGGILLFMASSLVAGLAQGFGTFLVARVLEGLGMGTMMPLSQAILGDLISPRERGRYQGLMGGVFGLASVIGPFLGGFITEHLSWRWLFFVNLPFGLLAIVVIVPFMKLPHTRRAHRIDYGGFITLSLGLTSVLLATVWGGSEFPWRSPQIVGLYALGTLSLALFLWIESRAAEPVLPLGLWKNGIFTAANIAILSLAMGMFGAIYFIPLFVQGVLGTSVIESGAVLTPMMLSIVMASILSGLLITRTGRYKPSVVAGTALLGIGIYLLTRMDRSTPYTILLRNMIVVGAGLGAAMQTFVLVVQNAVNREEMGVATATTQLFRSIGASTGVAVLGTVMTQRMAAELPRFLPGVAIDRLVPGGGGEGAAAGAVLDPQILATLPPAVLEGLRSALASALHMVFLAALPFACIAFVASLLLREIPLRRTVQAEMSEVGREMLAEMNQASEVDDEPILGVPNPAYRARVSFLGLTFGLLACQAERGDLGERGRLRDLVSRIGEGDLAQGRVRLENLARALMREVEEGGSGPARKWASPCSGLLGEAQLRLDGLDPRAEFERALAESPPAFRDRVRSLVGDEAARPAAVLGPAYLESLERIGIAVSAALLLDEIETPASGSEPLQSQEP